MTIIKPSPVFLQLTAAEVQAALADPDPANPIACEVARLIEGYTANFKAHCDRIGRIPDSIMRANPGSAIESMAMDLTSQVLQDALTPTKGNA